MVCTNRRGQIISECLVFILSAFVFISLFCIFENKINRRYQDHRWEKRHVQSR